MGSIDRIERRSIAIITTLTGFRNDYERRQRIDWLDVWSKAAREGGRKMTVVDPGITKPEILRKQLAEGTFGTVVLDHEGVDYYTKVHPSEVARRNFRLVYRMRPNHIVDEVMLLFVDSPDHILHQ